MTKLSNKTIRDLLSENGNSVHKIGLKLRRLRTLSGLTQEQVAKCMGIQQATISKIENGGEVFLTTVKRYVEALGASLRVDALFPMDTLTSLKLENDYGSKDQLVLPLFSDELIKSQREVVLSIKPFYSEKILEGLKTVELRRRFPESVSNGGVAYIYATSPIKAMVGIAEIRDVLKLPIKQIWKKFEKSASIEREDFDKYFEGLSEGYALVFEEVKAFSRPLPLNELRKKFGFEPPQSFLYAKHDFRRALHDG